MTTKDNTAADNQAALAALRGAAITVEVNGIKTTLRRPSRPQFVAITQYFIDNQEALEALKENKDLDRAMQEMEKIVMLCVPGIETHEDAYDLIMAHGGTGKNELIAKCYLLCGIEREEVDKAAAADPTSSS